MLTPLSDGPSLADSPNPLSWWRIGIAMGLAILTIGLVLIAMLSMAWANEPCPNENVDVSRVDLIEHRSFPPKSVCRYLYETGPGGSALGPPEVRHYDSAPAFALLVICLVAFGAYGWWFVRDLRRYPW
jgi:hypothetical protein